MADSCGILWSTVVLTGIHVHWRGEKMPDDEKQHREIEQDDAARKRILAERKQARVNKALEQLGIDPSKNW